MCSLAANLALDLGHASLQLDQLHIQGRLLTSEGSRLLLQAAILVLLVRVVSFHFFLDLEVLIGQSLADLLGLQSDH